MQMKVIFLGRYNKVNMKFIKEVKMVPGLNLHRFDNYHIGHQHHHHLSQSDLWYSLLDICRLY
jgi:hypothetical protein